MPNFSFEAAARLKGYQFIAGVDEAGRGPLAGPVVAAACLLPEGFDLAGIDDSKVLSPAKRAALYEALLSYPGLRYGVGIISAEIIDEVNILQATRLAVLEAVSQTPADYLLIDGAHIGHPNLPFEHIVKGDSLSISIAAASIIAKVTRDRLMEEADKLYPAYGFARHSGYGTLMHRQAIAEHGPCAIHRRSFRSSVK